MEAFELGILAVYKFNLYSTKIPLMEKPGDYLPLEKCVKVIFGRVIY